MCYGAAVSAAFALSIGDDFTWPSAPSWWISLLYLALAGSVLTFACFLTLQERIGPGPAASIGVMTPLLALVVSIAFEGFRPEFLTLLGAALAVTGNVLMLRTAAFRDFRPGASTARCDAPKQVNVTGPRNR